MSDKDLVKKLAGISFLHDIDPARLEQIASIAEVCEYDVTDILFHEGDTAEYVYFVLTGVITLKLCPSTIYQKDLLSVGRGEMLGWSAFVEQCKYASTGVAVAPTQLIRIKGKRLRAMCDSDPEFGYDFMHRIMRALAKRLTTTWTQLANIYVPMNLPIKAAFEE